MAYQPPSRGDLSIYSEHARAANEINARIAAIEADRLRRKGELVGGTLQMLGQIPLEIQQGQRQAAQDALAQAREQRLTNAENIQADQIIATAAQKRQLSDALRQAKTPLEVAQVYEQFDPEKADKIHERNRNAAAQILANSTAGNWDQAREAIKKYVPPELASSLPDQYPDTPDIEWKVQTVRDWTATPKDYVAANTPKPPDVAQVDTTDASGQPVTRFVPKQAGTEFPKPPPVPRVGTTPNVGSFEDYVTRKYGANPTDAQILEARKAYGQADDRPISVTVPGGSEHDPKDIAEAIINGDQPPTLQGLYRFGASVRAELARRGYDLAAAQTDWNAIQRYTSTLNGAQQTRLRQATEFVKETVPLVRDLSTELTKQLPRSQYPILNAAALAAAQNGVLGPDAQAAATTLSAQIADMQSELAVMYRGGNASTDEALKKAGEMLKGNWSAPQLEAALKLIERNATIRLNSIRNTGVGGLGGGDNRYVPTPPPAPVTPTLRYNPATGRTEPVR